MIWEYERAAGVAGLGAACPCDATRLATTRFGLNASHKSYINRPRGNNDGAEHSSPLL